MRPLLIMVCLIGMILGLLTWLLGCVAEPPAPSIAPPAEDLSTWTVPELVQPQRQGAEPERPDEKPLPGEKVYPYAPGTTYAAPVALGWPLDIILERGEVVRNIVGGDRAPAEGGQAPRWEVKEGTSGQGDEQRGHVFVTATEAGLTLGVIITTSKRTYYVTCQSVQKSPIRVVRWQYPASQGENKAAPISPQVLPDPTQPMRYHIGYEWTSSQPPPDWRPRAIYDDGRKMYILYPEVALFGTVPVIRMLGPNGPQIINARQYLNVVILDQLAARLELRIGIGERAETVTITRGQLQTIECPGSPQCPQWPQAASILAGRTR